MKPEHWKEVERLYNAAMEIKPAERAAFLMDACVGNESLRTEVESLLAQGRRSGSFIESPVMERIAGDVALDSPSMSAADAQMRRRAPWWMCAVAAAFVICAAVRYYGYYVEPENPGIQFQPLCDKHGSVTGALIKNVLPHSAAASAGLEKGDILSNWMQPTGQPFFWQSGHTYRLEIKHNTENRVLFLTPVPKHWRNLSEKALFVYYIFLNAFYLVLAVIVAFARPYDPVARWGALLLSVLALGSFAVTPLPTGWFSLLLDLPRAIGWLVNLLPPVLVGLMTWIAITFAAVFPRPLFQGKWLWILVWLPAAIVMPWLILQDRPPFYAFPRWWPDWYYVLMRLLLVAGFFLILLVMILNYRRCYDLNQRRRVRMVVAGLLATLMAVLPLMVEVNLSWWGPVKRIRQVYEASGLPFLLSFAYLAFPSSIAYAILRHRLFDIRVLIRQGLQYAAARSAILSLVPFVALVLAGDLLLHGNQALMHILRQRGWLYAVLAGGGLLFHHRRRVWLDALDRRFFRERYNAQRVLRAVVDEVRAAHNFEKVAPRVVEQIEAALHPEFAALLMRQPGADRYRVLASNEKALPPISADSKIIGMLRLLGKPLEVSQSQTGWLRQLPQQEIQFLQHAGFEWLFPICLVEGQTEALLTLGPKRSEEPYSWEDQELLLAIASSIALLLDKASQEGFEECPECGTCYDSGSQKCQKEGADLTPLAFPRVLVRRYRFEQRLGAGGMGIVYESFDTELRRRVAVKLMRSELTVSPEAVARFKREARSAASFTHPNVVTVHDFGIAEGPRAYLVMELLQGSTLRQELDRRGRLTAPRALEILGSVCNAVSAAHHRNLLHRDLKPENIFLACSEGVEITKILDFGIAKPMAGEGTTSSLDRTGPGMLLGTLMYMSPEELRGEKPAVSWDLWALAVVAYEMLTGIHPFKGPTSLDISNRILAGRATPLRMHLPEAPPGWQHFFNQTLATNVALRPASASQLYCDFCDEIENLKSAKSAI
jgi:eukaryotic-like serine/threonine-protein kinase